MNLLVDSKAGDACSPALAYLAGNCVAPFVYLQRRPFDEIAPYLEK